jgi:hypothetical protein
MFVKFLVDTYSIPYLRAGSGVVEVAAGRGEVSLRLNFLFCVRCTLAEPREIASDPDSMKRLCERMLRRLPKFYRQRLLKFAEINTEGIRRAVPPHFRCYFDIPLRPCGSSNGKDCDPADGDDDYDDEKHVLKMHQSDDKIETELLIQRLWPVMKPPPASHDLAELNSIIESCSIVVGMHPDGATDSIVDCALAHGKPFAIVPCCVFPTQFPNRRRKDGSTVTTHAEYITWLQEKDPAIEVRDLGFGGANKVVFMRKAGAI